LVILGQAPGDLGLLRQPFSSAPLTLSADRVVPQNAGVRLSDPNHPLLANPNHLAATDFDGWSGERAVFMPVSWGTEVTPLLEIGGSGEGAARGALLVSRVGDGWFVYTTLNLNRQWREGIPGPYRLLGNLASLAKSPKPQTNPQ